jgi:hypothetical protein
MGTFNFEDDTEFGAKSDPLVDKLGSSYDELDYYIREAAVTERIKADIQGTIPISQAAATSSTHSSLSPQKHFMIPDTQVKPGVPLYHLEWIGQYLVDNPPDRLIMIGDWYDVPSLSSYDRGKKSFEGRRLMADLDCGHRALELLEKPMEQRNAALRRSKHKQITMDKHVTWGNHEHRISRTVENVPELDGLIGVHILDEFWRKRGWTTHQYTEVVDLDGVWYSHCFLTELTGRAIGAMASTMLKQIGHTFTQGHRQTYEVACRYVGQKMQRALIAGACYLHDEEYKGPHRKDSERSANYHWRGCVMKHDVADGEYSLMELPLDYFCRRYEGMTLERFMRKVYPAYPCYGDE